MTAILQILAIVAGALFAALWAWAAGHLIAPRTALPHVIRFTTGAVAVSLFMLLLLSVNAGYLPVYVAAAAFACVAVWRLNAPRTQALPKPAWPLKFLLAAAAGVYLVIAIAPEIQPDAVAYHLRLTGSYVALHRFANHLEFFDVMPQGAQMLFVPAYAVGGREGAKLLHFIFFLATVPLIRLVAREFGVADSVAGVAAALFFLSPVAGIDGTCAYTDMILVCACLSCLYLLLRWNRERSGGLLLCAGLNAGFCYSVKQTFGWIALAAVIFAVVRGRAFLIAAWAAIPVVPWMLRAFVLTGDPFAPFLNRFFPDPASNAQVEAQLTDAFSAFGSVFSWRTALVDYTVRGGRQGLLGVAFLLLPLAALGLRRRQGRRVLLAALALAIPVLANTGTRFLLPALSLLALSLALVLPRRIAFAVVVIQAGASVPAMLNRFGPVYDWRLREIPWQAALRIEPEAAYINRALPGMELTALVRDNTPPGVSVFLFEGIPEAYTPRTLLTFWYSADALRFVAQAELARFYLKTNPPRELRYEAMQNFRRHGYEYFLIPAEHSAFEPLATEMAAHPQEWGIHEQAHYAWHRLYRISAPSAGK